MTEDTLQTDVTDVLANWEIRARDYDRLVTELAPANKAALFDALVRAGISRIIVQFDGYGDSGQIEDILAYTGDSFVEIPTDRIEYVKPAHAGSGIERSMLTLHDAVETLAYDFLEENHAGWEDNDGAFGDFTFDTAQRTITLAYNERHMESDYSEHVF